MPKDRNHAASNILETHLGELELKVLAVLWQRPHLDACQIREKLEQQRLPSLSTVQSTLERLYHKMYLDRIRQGQSYSYFTTVSRSVLLGKMLSNVVQLLRDGKMETILSSFVHVAENLDERSLDDLEVLIRKQRERQEERPGEH